MTPVELYCDLRQRGVVLIAEGDTHLRWRAQRGVVTDDLRAVMRQNKASLIEVVNDAALIRMIEMLDLEPAPGSTASPPAALPLTLDREARLRALGAGWA